MKSITAYVDVFPPNPFYDLHAKEKCCKSIQTLKQDESNKLCHLLVAEDFIISHTTGVSLTMVGKHAFYSHGPGFRKSDHVSCHFQKRIHVILYNIRKI